MTNESQYMVSIRLMAYNHGQFIHQAMEGILNQKTDFKVEVVVGDDFSPDNTLEVVKRYSGNDNINIRILDRKEGDEYWQKRKKLGRLHNFMDLLNNCTGKYIALLDGDDYWTDPLKLQRQVDFLEGNPNHVLSFHDAVFVDEKDKTYETYLKERHKRDIRMEDIGEGFLFPTLTVVFRKEALDLPRSFYDIMNADTFLFVTLLRKGDAHFHGDIKPAHYRRHSEGLWSKRDNVSKIENLINTFHQLTAEVQPRHRKYLYQLLSRKALTYLKMNVYKLRLMRSISALSKLLNYEFQKMRYTTLTK